MSLVVCGIIGTAPKSALADLVDRRYEVVALVQDQNRWVNARSGPSLDSPVKKKVPTGQLVVVTDWPGDPLPRRMRSQQCREALLASKIDPDDLVNWRWVILLERGNPANGKLLELK
jgi:hypothetical protein